MMKIINSLSTKLAVVLLLVAACKTHKQVYATMQGVTERYVLYRNGAFDYFVSGPMTCSDSLRGKYHVESDSIHFYFDKWRKNIEFLNTKVIESHSDEKFKTINAFIIQANGDTITNSFESFLIDYNDKGVRNEFADTNGKLIIYGDIRSIQVYGIIQRNIYFVKNFQSNVFDVFVKDVPDFNCRTEIEKTVEHMKYNANTLEQNERIFYRQKYLE